MENKDLLIDRKKRFDAICSNIKCTRPTDLSAIVDIDEDMFENLKIASKIYLSKVLKSKKICLTDEEIIKKFSVENHKIPNITPSGMILPKRYSTLEYNLLMKTFYHTVSQTLMCDDKISKWHIPMHIRVKYPKTTEENLDRPRHASENIHMDSWSGYSSFGITCIIPLFGDVINNSLEFWRLKGENFDENWMFSPMESGDFNWKKHSQIIENYEKVSFKRKERQMFLFDASTVHATYRNQDGCGTRFSIDNILIPESDSTVKSHEKVSKERQLETRAHGSLLKIGEQEIFNFPDTDKDIRDSKQGSTDPTNFSIQRINEK